MTGRSLWYYLIVMSNNSHESCQKKKNCWNQALSPLRIDTSETDQKMVTYFMMIMLVDFFLDSQCFPKDTDGFALITSITPHFPQITQDHSY